MTVTGRGADEGNRPREDVGPEGARAGTEAPSPASSDGARFRELLAAYANDFGLEVDVEAIRRLHDFWRFLSEENRRHNLTAIVDEEEAVVKHFLDSLTVFTAEPVPRGAKVVDIGSGAGFPGIPMAIARPDLSVTLVESVGKKANFMRRAAEHVGLGNVKVVRARAEDAAREPGMREQFDLAVARALAPLPVACEWCLPFVRVGGHFIAMRGAKGMEDLEEARGAMAKLGAKPLRPRELELPGGAGRRVLVSMKKVKPVGREYPRPGGQARRRPL